MGPFLHPRWPPPYLPHTEPPGREHVRSLVQSRFPISCSVYCLVLPGHWNARQALHLRVTGLFLGSYVAQEAYPSYILTTSSPLCALMGRPSPAFSPGL